MLEFAKTGRATCKGSCKEPIAAGQLRFGTQVEMQGHASFAWRCLGCVTKLQAKNALAVEDLDSFIGFPNIPEETKADFIAYLRALADDDKGAANNLLAKLGGSAPPEKDDAPKKKEKKQLRPVDELEQEGREHDWKTLNMDELKELLRAKKQKISGKKDELLERVAEAYKE